MSYLVFFSVTPLGTGESVSRHVAKAVRVVERSGYPWQLGPMGTTFEAPTLAAAFKVLAGCDRALAGCRRVGMLIKIDRRAGGMGRLTSKVASVRRKLRPAR